MSKDLHKILIADDDERNIFAICAVLRSRGYLCVPASSGERALALLQSDPAICLALIDIMMPGIDGYELMRKVRATDRLQRIRLIAVTARAMSGDREKCFEAGADAYLSKPVDAELLFTVVQEQLTMAGC
ncbi:MAG: response regulator [Bacteroidota bacterium]|nr:response regulator [Bacteroidota bacterium]